MDFTTTISPLFITLNADSRVHLRLESCHTYCGIQYDHLNNPKLARDPQPKQLCAECVRTVMPTTK